MGDESVFYGIQAILNVLQAIRDELAFANFCQFRNHMKTTEEYLSERQEFLDSEQKHLQK